MSQNHLHRQMQEALDGDLAPELVQEFLEILNQDQEASLQYERLQSIEILLRAAPYARAPERLALTIMQRITEAIQAQPELQELPQATLQALMFSLSQAVMLMLPTMLAASWMVLYLNASLQVLNQVINQVIALLVMVIDALKIMLEEAEALVKEHPDLASFMVSLIPLVFLQVFDSIEDRLSTHEHKISV